MRNLAAIEGKLRDFALIDISPTAAELKSTTVKSPPETVTSVVIVAGRTTMLRVRSWPTLMGIPVYSVGPKPFPLAVTLYVDGETSARYRIRRRPTSTVRCLPFFSSTTVIVAFGTTAPVLSVTVPAIRPSRFGP